MVSINEYLIALINRWENRLEGINPQIDYEIFKIRFLQNQSLFRHTKSDTYIRRYGNMIIV